jgi:hypothetical protein
MLSMSWTLKSLTKKGRCADEEMIFEEARKYIVYIPQGLTRYF